MYRGKLGNWLAVRMGNDLHEMDKGVIPNQARSGGDESKCWIFSILTKNFEFMFPIGCYLLQGRNVHQARAGTEGEWGQAGVRTQSRVLETTGAQREQEE